MMYNAQKTYDKTMDDKGRPAYALLIFSTKQNNKIRNKFLYDK